MGAGRTEHSPVEFIRASEPERGLVEPVGCFAWIGSRLALGIAAMCGILALMGFIGVAALLAVAGVTGTSVSIEAEPSGPAASTTGGSRFSVVAPVVDPNDPSEDNPTADGTPGSFSASDGDVRFDLRSVECGGGPLGDADFEPSGMFCMAHLSVENAGPEAIELALDTFLIIDGVGVEVEPDPLAAEAAGTDLTDRTLGVGESVDVRVVWDVPAEFTPASLRLYATETSPGAEITIQS